MSHHSSCAFFFGDSLTDVDVIFGALVDFRTAQILAAHGPNPTDQQIAEARMQATAEAQAQFPEFGSENAVTNEFTHVNYLADVSGANVKNYANAGARALGEQEPFGPGTGYDSNLGGQLDRFAAATSGTIEPGSKAIFFIGANDFSDALGAALDAPGFPVQNLIVAAAEVTNSLLGKLESAARAVHEAGVETIFFGTLPAATFFPAQDVLDDVVAGFSDAAVAIYNSLLAARAQDLRSDGINVEIIDYGAVANAITNDPSGFGILAERDDFLIDGSTFDSDQVGFWDPVHPAEAIHQAWGIYAAFVMDGGSTTSMTDFGTISIQGNGNNAVFANGGNDTVLARAGDDIVFGGTGWDFVYAGSGDDIVSGGTGNDHLRGQFGNDIVAGGSGNDNIRGGHGDDVLIDGLGNDTAKGGWGDDVFIFVEGSLEGDPSASQDSFHGGHGDDTLYLVLDEDSFADFEAHGVEKALSALGISVDGIENIVAINGRGEVEGTLGDFSWFQDGDYWGLVPAPTPMPDEVIA